MRHTTRYSVLITLVLAGLGFLGLVVQGTLLQAPSSGTWAPAPGALAEARSNAAAAALADGSVLVTGGDGAAGSAVASAELFGLDGSFSSVASMSFPRSKHVAVALKDGRVLVAGGNGVDGNASNSAEIFDPTSGAWQAAGAMLEPRAGATATRLSDGKVLIAGGANGDAASMTLELFDPTSDSFVSAGVMSSARKDHAAALLAGNPALETSDKVLLAGGSDGTAALASTEIWDAASGAVVSGPALSVARSGLSATTLLDGSVLIAGGAAASGELGLTEVFDPASGLLELASSQLAAPRQKHLAIFLPHNSAVLFVGGTAGGTAVSAVELYMPWAGGFVATGQPSAARADAAASAASEGMLVVAGGCSAGVPTGGTACETTLASAEVYGFATLKTDKDDYAPGEIVTITGLGWESGDDVILTLHETNNPEPHPDRIWIVTADANGNLFDNSFYPEEHDLGVRFILTAEGARSQAQLTFTDARSWDLNFAGTGSGSVTITPSTGTVNASVSCGGTGAAASLQTVTSTCTGISTSANGATITFNASATGVSTFAGWSAPNSLSSSTCTGTTNPCSAVIGTPSAALTVTFNPGAANKLAITSVNGGANPTAGTGFSVVVRSQDSNGNLSNVVLATGVSLSLNTGTGTLGGTLSGTIAAGTNSVTISGVTYTKAESGVILTATRTIGDSLLAGNSAPFTVNPGAAAKFAITGSGSQTAGTTNNLTITAQDSSGNTVTGYTGNHTLIFSGASASTNPATNPTVTRNTGQAIDFGTGTPISFAIGVATVSGGANGAMTLYKAEAALVHVTDGSISSSGGGDLSVLVSAGSLNSLQFVLASPQTSGVAFTGTNTLTALDSWGNTATAFDASANNVTITRNAPLTGTVSGLGSLSNNVLNLAGNFASGVANLAGLMKYTGNAATGTFTALSASGKTGTSGNVTINAGAATKYLVTSSDNNPVAGTAVTISAQLADADNNPVSTAGKTVTWSKTGTGGSFASPTSLTNGSGVATVSFTTHTVSDTVHTVTATDTDTLTGTSGNITTKAGALDHFLVEKVGGGAIPTQTAGTAFDIMVTAQDSNNNTATSYDANGFKANLTSTGNLTFVNPTAAFASGVLSSASVTITNTGTFTITATSNGPISGKTGTSNSFLVNPGAANKLALSGSTADLASGSTRLLTATIQDANGNTVTTAPDNTLSVTFAQTGGTGSVTGLGPSTAAGGIATLTVTGNLVGSITITASATASTGVLAAGTGNPITFNVIAGPASATNSNITGTGPVVANGTSTSTITIILKDANSNPISGVVPTFSASGTGNAYGACSSTNASGESTCSMTSTVWEVKTLSIVTPVADIGGTVTFTSPDNTPPETSITPPTPANPTNSTSASFTFAGTDNLTAVADLVFECQLDAAGFAPCTSAKSYLSLSEGSHTFQVKAKDQAGNYDLSPASFTWTVDTTPPVIAAHGDETAEATSAAGAVVSYSSPTTSDAVDGAGVANCLPASSSLFALGDTTVNCTKSDAAGNPATPTSFVVHVVDTTPPVIAAHGDETAEATSAAGANVSYTTPTTSDAVDGAGVATCLPASGALFALGNTTVTCDASDAAGNHATATTFAVHVQDTTPPVIAAHAEVTQEATSAAGAVVSYSSPTTSDAVDGAGTATCAPPSGGAFALGDTTVTCNATDAAGNPATATTFVVHVVDTTPPVLSGVPSDMTLEATGPSGAVANWPAPTANDVVDGVVAVICAPASGSTFALGTTPVDCSATDAHNNAAHGNFNVIVQDTTPPTIDPHGPVSAEATGPSGAAVTYTPPATHDLVDGDGVASCAPASGSTFALGDTTVDCDAVDAHGNHAVTTHFTVSVVDTTPPDTSITSNPANPTNITSSSFAFTGSDLVTPAGSLTFKCAVDGGSFAACTSVLTVGLSEGLHTFQVEATDAAGNTDSSPASFTWVIDTTPPDITGSRSPAANGFGWNNTDVTVGFSCTDPTHGGVSSGLAAGSPSGGTTLTTNTPLAGVNVTGTCLDNAGNSASTDVGPVKIDKTAPTLSPIISPLPVLLNGSSTATPNATDTLSGIDTQSCPALSLASVGSKTVTCTATDKAGNTGTANASYSVVYATGACLGNLGHAILQPIDFTGASVFPKKQGSTVPAKFRVCDANGVSIGTPGVVAGFVIYQTIAGTVVATVNEDPVSTTPDAAFRWSGDQWIYNISTKSLNAGTTYFFRITLNDGTKIDFNFGLK